MQTSETLKRFSVLKSTLLTSQSELIKFINYSKTKQIHKILNKLYLKSLLQFRYVKRRIFLLFINTGT